MSSPVRTKNPIATVAEVTAAAARGDRALVTGLLLLALAPLLQREVVSFA